MIYSSTSAHANGYDDSSTNDMSIGTSAFNPSRDDNTYVGYMFGTKGASTYANTHSNTTNSTTIGNGKLTRMIGLITSDEVMYAGGISGTNNKEYYLYSGEWYWTMAPYFFSVLGYAYVGNLGRDGDVFNSYVSNNSLGVRPVVSLKSDAISDGSGTASSPFLVG